MAQQHDRHHRGQQATRIDQQLLILPQGQHEAYTVIDRLDQGHRASAVDDRDPANHDAPSHAGRVNRHINRLPGPARQGQTDQPVGIVAPDNMRLSQKAPSAADPAGRLRARDHPGCQPGQAAALFQRKTRQQPGKHFQSAQILARVRFPNRTQQRTIQALAIGQGFPPSP